MRERLSRLPLSLLAATLVVGLLFTGQHARAGTPTPTDAPVAAATAVPTPATPASATVLWSDTLSDPNTGALSKSSSQPANCQQGYVGGEYQLARVSPTYAGGCGVTVPGTYVDVAVSVDFHLQRQLSPCYGPGSTRAG